MKSLHFTIALVLTTSMSIAQSKQELKLEKLWAKDPSKCVEKAERFIDKNKALGPSYYYIALHRLQKAEAKQKASYFKRALKAYAEATEHPYAKIEGLRTELDSSLIQWSRQAKGSELKLISSIYFAVFHDTLQAYRSFLANKTKQEKVDENLSTLSGLDSLRKALLAAALKLEGVPYKWAGEDTNGFDCSGFTKYVYSKVGIELPHNAQLQALLEKGKEQTFEEAQPGDLVFFGSRNGEHIRVVHAAILFEKESDYTKVIHCVSGGVSVDGDNSSWEHHWKDRVLFSRTLLAVE